VVAALAEASLALPPGPQSAPAAVVSVLLLLAVPATFLLFHRRWESGCVVAAIVAVEVIISLTPVAVADSAIARRVLLWALLGTLISVATHGLKDGISRSQAERERLQDRLRELSVMEDRDRIAAELRDKIIQRIFAAGLNLQGPAGNGRPDLRSGRVAAVAPGPDDRQGSGRRVRR
jgi:signal transduction histidine kinase